MINKIRFLVFLESSAIGSFTILYPIILSSKSSNWFDLAQTLGLAAIAYSLGKMAISPFVLSVLNRLKIQRSYSLCVFFCLLELLLVFVTNNVLFIVLGRLLTGAFSHSQGIMFKKASVLKDYEVVNLNVIFTIGFLSGVVHSSVSTFFWGVYATLLTQILMFISVVLLGTCIIMQITESPKFPFHFDINISPLDKRFFIMSFVQANIPVYLSFILMEVLGFTQEYTLILSSLLAIFGAVIQIISRKILIRKLTSSKSLVLFCSIMGLLAFLLFPFSSSIYSTIIILLILAMMSPLMPTMQEIYFSNSSSPITNLSISNGLAGILVGSLAHFFSMFGLSYQWLFIPAVCGMLLSLKYHNSMSYEV